MENKDNNGFSYTYSAREQAELRRIRDKYTRKDEDKMERLRRLDRSVTDKAQIISLVFGIIGTLTLGLGMSFIMTELGDILGASGNTAMIVGIVVGIIGGALAALAYPAYNLVLRREREKAAPEILRLTDELLK